MGLVCFYHNAALMAGVDKHLFINMGPLPEPKVWHVTLLLTFKGPAYPANRTSTVTSIGEKMIQKGFKRRLVLHIPAKPPAAYDPLEVPTLALIIAKSKSGPVFTKDDVHGNGKPLAMCFYNAWGLNKNCSGDGVVLSVNSVVTDASLGDFAANAVEVAVNRWLKKAIPNPVLRWAVKKYLVKPHIPWLREKTKEFVDGLD